MPLFMGQSPAYLTFGRSPAYLRGIPIRSNRNIEAERAKRPEAVNGSLDGFKAPSAFDSRTVGTLRGLLILPPTPEGARHKMTKACVLIFAYIVAGVAVGRQFLDGVNALEDISGLKWARCDS